MICVAFVKVRHLTFLSNTFAVEFEGSKIEPIASTLIIVIGRRVIEIIITFMTGFELLISYQHQIDQGITDHNSSENQDDNSCEISSHFPQWWMMDAFVHIGPFSMNTKFVSQTFSVLEFLT